jgi:hypothetical protein
MDRYQVVIDLIKNNYDVVDFVDYRKGIHESWMPDQLTSSIVLPQLHKRFFFSNAIKANISMPVITTTSALFSGRCPCKLSAFIAII